MAQSNKDQEVHGFARLREEPEPLSSNVAAPLFKDASACSRVGCLITRAVLGEEQHELYRVHYGDQIRSASLCQFRPESQSAATGAHRLY